MLSEPPAAYTTHIAHLTAALDTLLSKVQQQVDATAADSHGSRGSGMRASISAAAGSTMRLLRGSSFSGKGARTGPDVSWVPGVVSKMKGLLLEADRWVEGGL